MISTGIPQPNTTIHDLLDAYRTGNATPDTVFNDAVTAARYAHKGDGRSEWLYVVSPEEQEAQLSSLRRKHPHHEKASLYGIPFAVKDNIDVAGVPTTAACDAFKYTPENSAVCVNRLLEAGALFVGKTNLDQFATGLVGTRSPYGAVPSTFSDDHVAGGSSSGSAAVVSRGIVPFSLGTDTAGSGRVPAAFNNVVGLKPSVGRISTKGVLPACRSLDCVSVFALTSSDAASVLAVLESEPERTNNDNPDVRFAHPSPGPARFPPTLRIGVPAQLVDWMSPEYKTEFERLVATLRRDADISVVNIDFAPLQAIGNMLYGGPWLAERYLAMRQVLTDMPEEVDPTVRELVSPGEEISATDVFKGVHELTEQRVIAEQIWERVDILLTPAAPSHPRFEDVAAAPIEANAQLGAYTTFVNLLGWCALVTPCKTGHVPFGVQWIARAGHDVALLALGCGIPILPGAIAPKNAALGGADAMPHKEPISERVMRLAVVGAHLAGMPLHHEMQRARAKLVSATSTSPHYRLFALRGTVPPKPGLVRVAWRGHAILIEVYDVPVTEVGHFLDGIPHPLGLGTVETADGEWVTGFIAEPCALHGATDVTRFGGWRAFIAAGSLQWSLLYTATVATGVSGALALSAWVVRYANRSRSS